MELTLSEEPEKSLVHGTSLLSLKHIQQLEQLKASLQNQLTETIKTIDEMKKKLENLWNVLDVSPSIKNKFKKLTGYSQLVYDRFYEEVMRCENERRQNIKRFIDKARNDIEYWWNKTLMSEDERNRFSNFYSDCYTEDLLTLHELELDELQRFYYNNE